jgi:hypothetical protein
MAYNNYLPDDELYGESKLKGIYRVSFDIQVRSDDELSLSDVAQALTEGFGRGFGEDFVSSKVADLSIEKVTKKAAKVLKVGDKVQLKSDLDLKAEIYSDDGYVFIGNKNEISESVTTEPVSITVFAGSIGYINRINKDGSLEVADLDKPYVNSLWQEIGLDSVNIDLITVKAEQLERIDSEEVK